MVRNEDLMNILLISKTSWINMVFKSIKNINLKLNKRTINPKKKKNLTLYIRLFFLFRFFFLLICVSSLSFIHLSFLLNPSLSEKQNHKPRLMHTVFFHRLGAKPQNLPNTDCLDNRQKARNLILIYS